MSINILSLKNIRVWVPDPSLIKGRYYYQHVQSHDQSKWKHQCFKCGQKCQTKTKLTEHHAISHTAEAKFFCDRCQLGFLTTSKRSLHKKNCRGSLKTTSEETLNLSTGHDIINDSLVEIKQKW